MASLVLLGLLLWWLLRSPWGRAFAALRDNPIRAESLGVNITAYTLLAFAIGAAYAGIGGVYFASLVQFIEPGPFHFADLAHHAARRHRRRLGPILRPGGRLRGDRAAAGMVALLQPPSQVIDWYLAVFGFAVVALMVWLPGGLLSIADRRHAEGGGHDASRPSFLEVKDMHKSYGAIRAVDGVSLSVGPGEIVGVIGPNGSGKTTLFNSILGQIKPTAGTVEFCGEDITGLSPLDLARRGVGRTFQTLQVFSKLSVRDNLIVAAQEFKGSLAGRLFAAPDAGLGHRADEMIELFRLQPCRASAGGQPVATASRS